MWAVRLSRLRSVAFNSNLSSKSHTFLIVLSFFITMAFDFEDLLFQLEEAENGNEMLEAIDAYVEGVA